jgi:hypothetical protein
MRKCHLLPDRLCSDILGAASSDITVGVIEPVGCVATATDGSICLAMLVRRDGETLHQLLLRLDLAVARAFVDDIFTDEVNLPARKK